MGVDVFVGVEVLVGVDVGVGVRVGVEVLVAVGVWLGVEVGACKIARGALQPTNKAAISKKVHHTIAR